MFVVEFNGGIGNQMFEFSFMKQLEKRYPSTRVRANIFNKKDYALDRAFGITLNECSWQTAVSLADIYPRNAPFHSVLTPLSKYRQVVFGRKNTSIIQDDYTCFYPEYYQLNPLNWYYFKGVWANSQYLVGVEEEIKKCFDFGEDLTEKNKKYVYEMSRCNSVSIHVRRGDYVTLGLPLAGEKFYMSAVKYMCEKTADCKFFVFSNDIEYCRNIFSGYDNFVYVEGNTGDQSFRDMQLMSKCSHNIISNSTFSFWGAYLNSNPNKIVVAPNIGVGTVDFNTPFACPEWIKLDV